LLASAWLTSPQAMAPARVPPVVARKARRESIGSVWIVTLAIS
jgi:hypothetical protein